MLTYVIRRLLAMIPTLFLVSVLTFIIIQLPPGDFLTTLAIQAAESGGSIDESAMESLRRQYGLDQPKYVQYLTSIAGFPRGDFGYSVEWKRPRGRADRQPARLHAGAVRYWHCCSCGWWRSPSGSTPPLTSTPGATWRSRRSVSWG